MVLSIGVVAGLTLAGLTGYIASRPSEFRISRSRIVAAPPHVVHGYVHDFHKWREWSPWERLDPSLKREYSGAPAGPGAVYSWSGNRQVGEGRMTITDSRVPQSLTLRLEFIKPWAATNFAHFDFVPGTAGTNVTWTMAGRNNFMAKAFGLFIDMDKMVGSYFEKGLEDLDAVAGAAVARRAGGDRS
jgi:Polyketide cyclase / dehydrase and lipid transport